MSPRRNILFLFSDQHRADALQCAGHPVARTPNMDRLAGEGVRFDACYCSSPLCAPSRVATVTGRYPHNVNVPNNSHGKILPDEPMLSNAFRSAGYETAFIGKLHLKQGFAPGTAECADWLRKAGWDFAEPFQGKAFSAILEERDPHLNNLETKGLLEKFQMDYRRRCFSHLYPEVEAYPLGYAEPSILEVADYQDSVISNCAVQWLENRCDERPFFAWVNWGGPHDPWDAPGEFGTMFDPASMTEPIHDDLADAPEFLRGKQAPWGDALAEERWRRVKAQYYGMIANIDAGVGRMLAVLERRGELENTVVVYSSDHGEMLGDHGMFTKMVMYEASVKVPLIIRVPGQTATVEKTPVSLLDLTPTLLDCAGIPRETMPILHGTSLAPVFEGRSVEARPVFSELDGMKMVRLGRWKYVTDPDWECAQLFDLELDPSELHNLAADSNCAAVVGECRDALLHWMIVTQNRP